MPPRLDPDLRQQIAEAIRDGGKRNEVARQFGVSVGSVTKIAQEDVGREAFDRSATKNATAARVADSRARRAAIASRLLDEAVAAMDDMHKPALVYAFGGRDNEYNEHLLDRPSFSDRRNLMTIAAVAIDKHVVLERHDSAAGHDDAKSMLSGIAEGLRAFEQRRRQQD